MIATFASEKEVTMALKKEFEKLKKQRVDLLDKSDEYREQVEENKRLGHEIKHLTSNFKDGQKKINKLLQSKERHKAREAEQDEIITSLQAQIATQNSQIV